MTGRLCLVTSCNACRFCLSQPEEKTMTTDYKQPQTVSTDALATLGTIIDETCGRDAIHLAVENVEAGEWLSAGQHVSLKDGVASAHGKLVGIVDPFLKQTVRPGERFWLVVYPRQITSLRHVWEHPDFPASADQWQPGEVKVDPTAAPVVTRKDYSKQWMTNWAKKHMGSDYYGEGHLSDEDALANALDAGHNYSVGPYESAREYINNEWWDHWETLTGEEGNRGEYFSCAC